MLLAGKAEYESRAKEHLMIEFSTIDKIQAEASPRVFNTHLPFSMLPVQQIKDKGAKVLHVYRNPKDSAVSMWFHYKQLDNLKDMTLRQLVHWFLTDGIVYGTWKDFLKQVQKFVQDNPDVQFLNMSFEETKRNPVDSVRRMARFLGVDASDKLCQDIADACSFQNMRKVEETSSKSFPEGAAYPFDQKMYRKGEIGDWKNYITVADSEAIDKAVAEMLRECDKFKIEFEP
nr:hypothetical protein BaRGS_007695 [Batillaria attramentaria]